MTVFLIYSTIISSIIKSNATWETTILLHPSNLTVTVNKKSFFQASFLYVHTHALQTVLSRVWTAWTFAFFAVLDLAKLSTTIILSSEANLPPRLATITILRKLNRYNRVWQVYSFNFNWFLLTTKWRNCISKFLYFTIFQVTIHKRHLTVDLFTAFNRCTLNISNFTWKFFLLLC